MPNKIENTPAIDSPLVDMVLNNLDSFNMQSLLNLAKHPKIAGLLINHRMPSVREVVASHKDHALSLINDKNNKVLIAAAKSNIEAARLLIKHKRHYVRAACVIHKELAVQVLKEADCFLKAEIAWYHEDLAEKIIKESTDPIDPNILSHAAKHEKYALQLKDHPESSVRARAVRHESVALQLVGIEQDEFVQKCMCDHLSVAEYYLNSDNIDICKHIIMRHDCFAPLFINETDEYIIYDLKKRKFISKS